MAGTFDSDARQRRFDRLVAPWRDDLFRHVFWLCRNPELAVALVAHFDHEPESLVISTISWRT